MVVPGVMARLGARRLVPDQSWLAQNGDRVMETIPPEPIPNGAGVGGQSYRSETSLSGERSGWDEFALRNNRIFYREVQNLSHAPPQAELRGLERTPRFLNPQAMVFARKSEKHSLQGACAYLFIIHFCGA